MVGNIVTFVVASLLFAVSALAFADLDFESSQRGIAEKEETISRLTRGDAAAIVQAQEEAKEHVKDRREAELKNADIRESSSASVGGRRVIFNTVAPVEPQPELQTDPRQSSTTVGLLNTEIKPWVQTDPVDEKANAHFVLSGTVWDQQVSELWWDYKNVRYRIFVNANFLLFAGMGEVEDEDTRYTVVTLLTAQQADVGRLSDTEWRPAIATFSSESLEYIIIDPKDDAKVDPEAFAGVEAMLYHYAANREEMEIRHTNAEKLHKARAAYLEANPPKKRDTIINFRPRKDKASSISTEREL
jgi:hypothetical protein